MLPTATCMKVRKKSVYKICVYNNSTTKDIKSGLTKLEALYFLISLVWEDPRKN